MKKLKEKQLGPWCTFCPPKTVRASHVENGWRGEFCCEMHKPELLEHERDHELMEDRITLADEQTWMRL
jgi:hypothetical protein